MSIQLTTLDEALSYIVVARQVEDQQKAASDAHALADAQERVDSLSRQLADLQSQLSAAQAELSALPAQQQQASNEVTAKRQQEDAALAQLRTDIAAAFPDPAPVA